MARPDDLLVVGHTTRAHGLRGEIVVRLTTNRVERVAPGSVLWCGDRSVEVETSRPFDRDHLVRFRDVNSRESAEQLARSELLAEPVDDPDELWVHELIGSLVYDEEGIERGRVEHVESNPASDLLVLDTGALVPVRFVEEATESTIRVAAPRGLFDL